MYVEMDEAIRRQPGDRYVTAILAELRIDTGEFSWLSAGHPPPLLVRDGKVVKTLETEAHTPLGVAFGVDRPAVTTESLQRGDVVMLYTDGVPEARLADGQFFTIERLAEFIERQAASGYTAPETLRRLRNAIVDYQQGRLQDDATAILVEWARGGERALLPQTVI
jgi:serine phosphatase RsbU (regulator of sigma subunit)